MFRNNKLLKSMSYAIEGMIYALTTQRNMRIHFGAAFLAMIASLALDLNKFEIMLVFFSIILVIGAELFNTAVEAVVDLVTDDYHPLAKIAKDTAAAAVLLCGALAVIVGFFVFFDKLYPLQLRSFEGAGRMVTYVAFLPIGLLALLLIAWQAYRSSQQKNTRR